IGEKERRAHAPAQQERERRIDLDHAQVGAARARADLDVRNEPSERQEVPLGLRRESGPERVAAARVLLIDRLEADFERAPEDARSRGLDRQDRVADPDVKKVEAGLPNMALDVV